jgi:DNA (cytosine-5)-methyltransferase 1
VLTVGSLFSGIGGFDLGLERAGMRVIWQSEIDPYASAVLRKHWPDVPNLGDIHGITGPVERPDLICGGFPCQPFSSAARGRNTADSYLWPEMLRVVQELQPTWVCGENVAELDRLALEQVCADLEASGYEVQTLEIPACAVGADHIRRRLWILGYSDSSGESGRAQYAEAPRVSGSGGQSRGLGETNGLPNRMDRLRCLGNAIHPDIAEVLGRAIMGTIWLRMSVAPATKR